MTEPTDEGSIPDEVLALPEFAGLLQGAPPAIWSENGVKTPETEAIVKNQEALANAGFGFYNSGDGKTNVVFNTQFTSPEEISAMDKAGKLRDFATPLDEVKSSLAGASVDPAATPVDPAAPAQVAPAPPAASLDKKLATARVGNLTPGSPSSGPVPGQGRVLNAILKPVV